MTIDQMMQDNPEVLTDSILAWKSELPEGISGEVEIANFTITEDQEMFHNIACPDGHEVVAGDYTKLIIDGKLMMSDTLKEFMDHMEFFDNVVGNVLINGLGMGCALSVIATCDDVTHITVIEKNIDVILLVQPSFQHLIDQGKVEIIQACAFDYVPKGKYNAVWNDIWYDLSPDNFDAMDKLRAKYAPISDWVGAWSEEEIRERYPNE